MFGDVLRRAREAAGLTQEKLALNAGLSPAYVNRLEVHKKSPSLEVVLRLCEALGVSPQTFIVPIAEYFEQHGTILPKRPLGRSPRGSKAGRPPRSRGGAR